MRIRLEKLHRENKIKSNDQSNYSSNLNNFLIKDSSIEEIEIIDTKQVPISKIEIIDRTQHTEKSSDFINNHLNIKEFELSNRDQNKKIKK